MRNIIRRFFSSRSRRSLETIACHDCDYGGEGVISRCYLVIDNIKAKRFWCDAKEYKCIKNEQQKSK